MLVQPEQDFVFEDVAAMPAPSLLREFSAPVKLLGASQDRLRLLAQHDTDPFVRWESGFQYATAALLRMVQAHGRGETRSVDSGAYRCGRCNAGVRRCRPGVRRRSPFVARRGLSRATRWRWWMWTASTPRGRQRATRSAGRSQRHCAPPTTGCAHCATRASMVRRSGGGRSKTPAWRCWGRRATPEAVKLAQAQFAGRGSMTDVLAALGVLAETDGLDRAAALAAFHARFKGDDLVLDKWFAIQAASQRPGTLETVQSLSRHPDFDLANPNRVRALISSFAANPGVFPYGVPAPAIACWLTPS